MWLIIAINKKLWVEMVQFDLIIENEYEVKNIVYLNMSV